MTGQVLTEPFHSRAHISRSLRFSSASTKFIHSQHPDRTTSWTLQPNSHPPAPRRPFLPCLPPWRQRWLLSFMSGCKGTQEDTLGFTSSAGFSHSCFFPFGKRKGKKQMEAACELSIGSHCRSGTWGEKTESAAITAPERWLLHSARTSSQPKCPLRRGCDSAPGHCSSWGRPGTLQAC